MSLYVDIEKKLGTFTLKVKFETEEGVLSLLGASGCGKSMTLKCIAGIETPDRGRIILDGRTLFDSEKKIDRKPQERRVGYLFQQYALFPNMTVWQNLKAGCLGRKEQISKIPQILEMVHMTGFENRKPHELSGGQQQRVALARILVNEPEVLLLDEPFSALDSHLRFTVEQDLRGILKNFEKPVLLVSHDRDEVYRLSDRIAVMNNGHIDCMGDKESVFADPGTREAARLTGCKNISQAEQIEPGCLLAKNWGLKLTVKDRGLDSVSAVGIRMHDIEVENDSREENTFAMDVVQVIENPFDYTVFLRAADRSEAECLAIDLSKERWEKIQEQKLFIHLPVEKLMLLR